MIVYLAKLELGLQPTSLLCARFEEGLGLRDIDGEPLRGVTPFTNKPGTGEHSENLAAARELVSGNAMAAKAARAAAIDASGGTATSGRRVRIASSPTTVPGAPSPKSPKKATSPKTDKVAPNPQQVAVDPDVHADTQAAEVRADAQAEPLESALPVVPAWEGP